MSNLIAIAFGCDIAKDPAQNRINHQAMVNELKKLMEEDGWSGVEITRFETKKGSSFIEIAPAEAGELTLETLRAFKARKLAELGHAGSLPEPEQKALFR